MAAPPSAVTLPPRVALVADIPVLVGSPINGVSVVSTVRFADSRVPVDE
jgi:hypothetical protein